MIKTNKILVIGLSFVERHQDNTYFTKTSIADYINELTLHFDECIWMTHIFDSSSSFKGKLNEESMRFIPLKSRLILINWLHLIVYLTKRPYVILYFPALLSLVPLIPIIRLFSKRMIVYLGNDYEQTIRNTNNKWIGYSLLYRFSIEYTLKIADVVIARGKYLASKARCFNKKVIETVPIGNLSLQNLSCTQGGAFQISDATKRILYLGQLLWSKGLGDLFKALQLLVKKHPDIPIVVDVVGDGADRQEIQDLTKKLNLESYVKFHGWVGAKDELYKFFSCADTLVVPTSFYPEGVPRVIDEALVLGLPVVATNVGGIAKEFTNNEVMLIEPNKPEQIAESVETMLFDPQVRKRYLVGAKCRTDLWNQYDSAAQQHARVLLSNLNDEKFNFKELTRENINIRNKTKV